MIHFFFWTNDSFWVGQCHIWNITSVNWTFDPSWYMYFKSISCNHIKSNKFKIKILYIEFKNLSRGTFPFVYDMIWYFKSTSLLFVTSIIVYMDLEQIEIHTNKMLFMETPTNVIIRGVLGNLMANLDDENNNKKRVISLGMGDKLLFLLSLQLLLLKMLSLTRPILVNIMGTPLLLASFKQEGRFFH